MCDQSGTQCPGRFRRMLGMKSIEQGSEMSTIVAIQPHPLTPDALPAEGEIIGYTGYAFYGEDFGDDGPTSGPLRIGERTEGYAPGFFAVALGFDGTGGDEVFVLFGDDRTRQTLHGYVLA